MMLDWNAFTPWSALAGGLLIGLAAAVLIAFNGRIAGISGIVASLLQRNSWRTATAWGWRTAFVAGILAAPWLYQQFAPLPEMQMPSSPWIIIAAGLLVGFGTRLGSGCTSGHGVCGLSRRSLRSLAATFTFMAAGVLTVTLQRHFFP